MKIVCQNEDFEKDMQDLVNLFYEDCPFSIEHNFTKTGKNVTSIIKANGKEYVSKFSLPDDADELLEKSLLKRHFKNELYDILSSESKKSLPWGSLTGVRPTKFARDIIERGEIKPYILTETLVKDYHVSIEKAKLATQILNNQKGIIKNDNVVDLFINIPICPTRCNYCSFISNELWTVKDKVDTYLDCVIKELEAVKKVIESKAYIVRTIYIGGGTPSVLTPEQLDRLLSKIGYSVKEFTVECGRADTITREKLDVLKKYGVTRICINPQTFCEATLKRIGRKTTNKQVLDAYMLAMEYDFVVNMDIIAGLSEERLGIFKRTINTLLELYPQNITVHTLSVKNAAQIRGQEMKHVDDVPKMVEYAQKTLMENGYKPYYLYRQKHQIAGLENVGYYRDDTQCLFNIDSMEDVSSVIAVGAGAISKRVFNLENRIERQPNCKFIPDYIERIDEMIEKKIRFFS
ncbi:MAG: coproporphyrinogen dehydrogenase HemZ [Clostridia bacterium]|nr:coproporphyrinogen dehydrogenase HemZ [Clostridia bacterium]